MDARNTTRGCYVLSGIAAIVFILIICRYDQAASGTTQAGPGGDTPHRMSQRQTVHLYFTDTEHRLLRAETRQMPVPETPQTYGRNIILALIEGPREKWNRTLPAETRLRALHILDNGTAYVDLSVEIRERHPGGIQMERISIFSMVNSLILNVPEISRVKILVGGRETLTLAGHLDLRFPFKAEMLMVR